MPAQSEKQARLFRLVRALQKGGIKPKKVSPQIRKMASTIKHKDKKVQLVSIQWNRIYIF